MSNKIFQDIHLTDEQLWLTFQQYWKTGNYLAAKNLLDSNKQLITKYANAEWYNSLTDLIYQLQNYPEFNKNQIIVSYLPPDLEVGEIYFQIDSDNLKINSIMKSIPKGSTTTTITYEDTLIEALAFEQGSLILLDQTIDETNKTVTFTTNSKVHQNIVCLVYSTDDSNLVVSNVTINAGSTTSQDSYSGELLSTMILDNNERNLIEASFTSSQITFNFENPTENQVVSRVCYIPTSYLDDILNKSTGTISTSSTLLSLLCKGFMVSSLISMSQNLVLADVEFVLDKANISTRIEPTSNLNCTIYYT